MNQNNIETACLNEAQAWFTQSNDTPCMTKPLYSEIHWLRTHLPAFNQIAESTYIPLENTPQGAQLLFPLLKQPPEVVDQPTKLSTATHKAGWLKAKETTASSKSRAHFGHYKTGAIHNNINEMHTLMVAIPLRSGCSYRRWKKGINIQRELRHGKTKDHPVIQSGLQPT